MLIRPALPADVPRVLPMVRAICAMHEAWDPDRYAMLPDVVARYEHWLPQRAADPRSVFLIAEAAPHLAGFLIATIEPTIPIYRLKEYAMIHDVWVEPNWRKQGVASQLVAQAIERFRALGATQVRLETAAPNEAARNLFRRHGFRVSTLDMLRPLT